MAPPIVVVTGPLGVGKTTVAHAVAVGLERGVHLQMDHFWAAVVDGDDSPEMQRAAGGAALTAAFTYVEEGAYSVVLDGFLFPDVLPEVGAACRTRDIPLHYVVLDADVETCLSRANGRAPLEDPDGARALHARFAELDGIDRHLVDATGPADEVAAAVAAGHRDSRFLVR